MKFGEECANTGLMGRHRCFSVMYMFAMVTHSWGRRWQRAGLWQTLFRWGQGIEALRGTQYRRDMHTPAPYPPSQRNWHCQSWGKRFCWSTAFLFLLPQWLYRRQAIFHLIWIVILKTLFTWGEFCVCIRLKLKCIFFKICFRKLPNSLFFQLQY